MRRAWLTFCILFLSVQLTAVFAADVVPTDIQQPGTQPSEIGNLESPDKCDNCHGGYNSSVEPAHNWRGSMMAQAGRDPIFWATMAIAEQDFDGSGDLCLRCHSTAGWLAGRSTPTDGSGLAAGDADGVECDYCHKLTNPDDSEHIGVMNAPFVANDVSEGWYGSGMSSIWPGSDKLGPYNDADARHQFMPSEFHRSADFCGTCHDVSNAVVGDLAHNHGALYNQSNVNASGILGAPVDGKAAFNNPPYSYGIVERTFSEFKAGAISRTLVNDFPNLPEELRSGALEAIYVSATANGTRSANYSNPTADRYYTCQSCHMRPVTGTGANKRGVPVRTDLPLHDMTGGNYWMGQAIQYLDAQNKLRLGGGLTAGQIAAMDDAALRAQEQLLLAASLEVENNEVRIINHTGHKLISGYPEGRRMWLNIKWYDSGNGLLREDGEYGPISVIIDDAPATVDSIVDLNASEELIFEAHMGMTREWAAQLISLGYDPGLPLSYDRLTGDPDMTLGQLADGTASDHETFHFVLNNTVTGDNRIPPYGMEYNEAVKRNVTPVPANMYLEESGVYEHYAEVPLSPPSGAHHATIDLLYQPTSWEYIQFLYLANDRQNAFLGDEGANMLDAWRNTGMATPFRMASATWGSAPQACDLEAPVLAEATAGQSEVFVRWNAVEGQAIQNYSLYYDQAGKAQLVAELNCDSGNCLDFTDSNLTNYQQYCYKVTATDSQACESDFSNILCATPQPAGQEEIAGAVIVETGRIVKSGKGKHATEVYEPVPGGNFSAGDSIVVRLLVRDKNGSPLGGATVNLQVSGAVNAELSSSTSDNFGAAEAAWQTSAPNRKGNGGTPAGSYEIRVSGLSSSTHSWNQVMDSRLITIN